MREKGNNGTSQKRLQGHGGEKSDVGNGGQQPLTWLNTPGLLVACRQNWKKKLAVYYKHAAYFPQKP